MINLDQVRTLEWKVKQAVQLIVHLRRENDTLRGRLSDTEVRLQELETLLESVRATQTEMESGIRNALEELDHLEGTESETPPVADAVQADPLSYPPAPSETVTPPPPPKRNLLWPKLTPRLKRNLPLWQPLKQLRSLNPRPWPKWLTCRLLWSWRPKKKVFLLPRTPASPNSPVWAFSEPGRCRTTCFPSSC